MEDKKIEMNFMSWGKEAQDAPSLVEDEARSGYVKCGENNDYYDEIYNISTKSPLFQAIVEAVKNYVCSFTTDFGQSDIDDVVEKCAYDYILFNGFCLFITEKMGLKSVKWVDFKNVRTNKKMDTFYYSKNWTKMRCEWLEYPAYDPKKAQEHSIFYFSSNTRRGDKVYPMPTYSGALLDIMTDGDISLFWNSSIKNNFTASAFVNFNNGVPSSDIQDEIEKKINKKFSGAGNAGKLLVAFNDSRDNAVTVERIGEDGFDTKYQSLVSTLQNRIFGAFRMNPILVGYNVQTGFSKEEFASAYDLAYITVILPIQRTLTKQFAKVGVDIEFNKLTIYQDGGTGVEDATEMIEG